MISQIKIDRATVENIKNDLNTAHRIHFATIHENALKRNEKGKYIGTFNVPFSNTIEPLFREITGLNLFSNSKNKVKRWCSIKDNREFEKIFEFIKEFKDYVFLRDALALSVALDFSKINNEEYTKLGALRKNSKYHSDADAIDVLVRGIPLKIKKLPFYCEADVVCAVPSNHKFLKEIAVSISHNFEMEDISGELYWENKKTGLKNLPIDEKWDKLEESNLIVDVDLTGKTVLLLDDLYQSGITMQFVAMKLQEAGANKIFGLSIVKSLNDTDNQ